MEQGAAHDRILDIVVEKDEVTWQTMIYELVKHESMNPWDVDVTLLARRYIQMLKKLKELDFRVSGKVVLAAAILLKLKSQKLLQDDIGELDRLMSAEEVQADEFYDDLEASSAGGFGVSEVPPLLPRTPQPRKRKVSIYDLMLALQKALEVRDRRVLRRIPHVNVEVPHRRVDITKLIGELYERIRTHFSSGETLTFSRLTEGLEREAKVHHFMSLLHLAHVEHRKVDLVQTEHFGEIGIVQPSDAQKAQSL
ncbi:segregation/condensation protein A [Candidatus Woesearchaeota archaeon]|nr:segregation/condensation protein A [Candidatus Woesearchaeota archaeon]